MVRTVDDSSHVVQFADMTAYEVTANGVAFDIADVANSICDKLIEFQETILPNGGDRHSELFRALFEKRQEVRERIVQEIHQLNHKGSL